MRDKWRTIPISSSDSGGEEPPRDKGHYRPGDFIDEFIIEVLVQKTDISELYSARGAENEHVAIKVFFAVGRNEALLSFSNAINVAVKLQHPNILEYIKVVPGTNQFYLVTPFCEAGTLNDWMESRTHIVLDEILLILHQVASALVRLHSANIVYGDLKLANIVVRSTVPIYVQITDFDTAVLEDCRRIPIRALRCTPEFAAPEQLQRNASPACNWDMFSFGVLIAILVTGVSLFSVDTSKWPLRRNKPDLRLLEFMAPALARLVASLLSDIPEHRPSAMEALSAIETLIYKSPSPPPRERQFTK